VNILTHLVKQSRGHHTLQMRQSVRKADMLRGWHWFQSVGAMASMVVREFDPDATIEFEASGSAYRMIVKKKEKTT
jgi:hypothetical protein